MVESTERVLAKAEVAKLEGVDTGAKVRRTAELEGVARTSGVILYN